VRDKANYFEEITAPDAKGAGRLPLKDNDLAGFQEGRLGKRIPQRES